MREGNIFFKDKKAFFKEAEVKERDSFIVAQHHFVPNYCLLCPRRLSLSSYHNSFLPSGNIKAENTYTFLGLLVVSF